MAEQRDSTDRQDGRDPDQDEHQESKDDSPEVPPAIVDEAERLSRLAREAVDENERAAYLRERDRLLAQHDFTARIRDEERAVLVLYPDEWVEDGTVYPDRIDDIDRGIERPLEGVGATDDWEAIHEHNTELAGAIEEAHGPDHGANARELADYMSNHYLKSIEDATGEELEQFVTEYYPRNTWTTDRQASIVRESVVHVFSCTDREVPADFTRDEASQ